MTEAMQARLQAYAEQVLPQWASPVVGPLARITDGWESELYTLALEHGPRAARQWVALVLRLYPGDGAADKAAHEFHGMRRLHAAGYPVPLVQHLCLENAALGQPFILMERIEGVPLWPVLGERPPAEQRALVDQFCALFVRLHRLEWRPFATEAERLEAAGPYVFVDRLLAEGRAYFEHMALPGFLPVVEWLAARRDSAACPRPAVVHRDFHPANVLLRLDGTMVVIDWPNLAVTDARFDLAWSLVLAQSHASVRFRDALLAGYETASGEPVEHLAFFEVCACVRRLRDVTVALTQGAARMGMRPEAAALMRGHLPAMAVVHDLRHARTGLRVGEVVEVLKA